MIDEPPITPDDTQPTGPVTALDERLAREEPPLTDEDTHPSRAVPLHGLADRLAREEPPLRTDDTHPLLAHRPSRAAGRGGRGRRWLAALFIIGALALAVLEGYILLSDSDDRSAPTAEASERAIDRAPVQDTVPLVEPSATPTALPADQLAAREAQAAAQAERLNGPVVAPPVLPTAAADEIAAALLNPIPEPGAPRVIVRSSAPFTIRPDQSRSRVVQYTVQEGDTLESIAEEFGLEDYYTLIWSNKSNKYNPLRPGNQLNILPEDGVYHEVTDNVTIQTLAAEYGVEAYDIIDAEYNDLFGSTPETLLVAGMWVVVPGGEAERELFLPVAASSSTGSGGGGAGVISGTYTLWGCTADVGPGSPPYSRPLGGYTWMRGFSPGGHTGVDLAGSAGDPVTAAGAGTVVFAGWSAGGYGNVVVVAHGSTFTLYAHLLSTQVSCGQRVSAGSLVGLMGSSGNSTGNHLHFEVRDAGFNALNPEDWIGF